MTLSETVKDRFQPKVLQLQPLVDRKFKSSESINGSDQIHNGPMKIIKDREEKSKQRKMTQVRDQRTPDCPRLVGSEPMFILGKDHHDQPAFQGRVIGGELTHVKRKIFQTGAMYRTIGNFRNFNR